MRFFDQFLVRQLVELFLILKNQEGLLSQALRNGFFKELKLELSRLEQNWLSSRGLLYYKDERVNSRIRLIQAIRHDTGMGLSESIDYAAELFQPMHILREYGYYEGPEPNQGDGAATGADHPDDPSTKKY